MKKKKGIVRDGVAKGSAVGVATASAGSKGSTHVASYMVRFESVGARRMTWEERIERPINEDAIVRAVTRKRCCGSRDIFATEDSDYAGRIFVFPGRPIGRYLILPGSGR